MANYTTDLLELDLCELSGDFSTITESGSGNLALGAGVDFVFQGTQAVDVKVGGTALRGMVSNKAGALTNTAGLHFFVWCQTATAGVMDSKAAGGKRIIVGTSTNNYMAYYVDGNDTNLEGGYKCYPVRYTTTATATIEKFGNPGASPEFVGAMLKNTGVTVKSSNFSVDAMRYGQGLLYIDGTGANFSLAAAESDHIDNKWGIATAIEGGVSVKGHFCIGQNSTGTPTSCTFTDSNKLVAFSDTEFSEVDFSKFSVDHGSSVVNITNCNFLAIGTNNPGQVIALNASSTVNMNVCNFNGIGLSTLAAGWTMTGCAWNGAGQITPDGASLDDCFVSNSTNAVAVVTDDLSVLSGVSFTSGGSGHAVDLPTVLSADRAEPWSCKEPDTTYGAIGTTDATIRCNVPAPWTLTIDVAGGASVPTYLNTAGSPGTVDIVAGATVEVISLVTGSRVRVTRDDNSGEIFNGTESSGSITFGTSYAGAFTVTVRKASGAPYYQEWVGSGTSTIGQTSTVKALQQTD